MIDQINILMYRYLLVLLIILAMPAYAETRFNPYTGLWEGNICANQFGWTWYQWQPIGSICMIRLPNGFVSQGVIVNQ